MHRKKEKLSSHFQVLVGNRRLPKPFTHITATYFLTTLIYLVTKSLTTHCLKSIGMKNMACNMIREQAYAEWHSFL